MAAGGKKTGAKKTVGRARKGDIVRAVVRLSYVQKPNGAYSPRMETLPPPPEPVEEGTEA
jgi:hypothetical protein